MKNYLPEFNKRRSKPTRAEPVSVAEDAAIYQRLVREVRDYAIFMLDRNGIVQTWNPGAERLKGYSPEEIIGQHFSRFFTQEDIQAQKPERELQTALAQGRTEDEGWRVRRDGTRFWADVVITAIYDEHGTHVGFAKVTRDLSERRAADEALRSELLERQTTEAELRKIQAELEMRVEERTAALASANVALAAANKELARANQELEQAGRMKDQFLAVLSHELRTPLTSIYGWLNLLLSGRVEQSNVRKGLQVIERNVRAQSQLVDDLLNLSRIVTGNLKVAPRWIEPEILIHAAVDSVRPAAVAKGVRTAGGDSEFQIDVTDTGEGIAPEFLPHVFDPFRQADSSTTRKFGGLGLGLSIVRHIVELHGGTVAAKSEGTGRGTTMTIRLPIPVIRSVGESASADAAPITLEGLRVMIVEDEPDTREVLREALQSYGASVLTAGSAGEALERIVQEKPDLILSDIGLPDVDGYELMSKVRSQFSEPLRNIPAVALTAFADAEHQQRSSIAGYQAHITKPVSVTELVSTLARVAGAR
jgi:PAS domain S-box-containing protein